MGRFSYAPFFGIIITSLNKQKKPPVRCKKSAQGLGAEGESVVVGDVHRLNTHADWAKALASQLREATRALHRRLDHSPRLAPLLRPQLTLAEYSHILKTLYAINLPIELRIADYIAANELPIDYESHRRMRDLAIDLAYLDLTPPAAAWAGPLINSPGALIGCFYVLAGSSLGGRVIFRQLQISLAVDEQNGAKFFAGHGEQTMDKWHEFWHFAAAICPASELPAAQQSATLLFESIIQHLERSHDDR